MENIHIKLNYFVDTDSWKLTVSHTKRKSTGIEVALQTPQVAQIIEYLDLVWHSFVERQKNIDQHNESE